MAPGQFYITGHTLIPGHRVTFNVIWNQESGPNTTADNFPEAEAQARYPAAVYNYWQNRGGRGDATGYDHYHVFRVLDHHFDDLNVLYKVQWEGFPPTQPNCTWEPLSKLIDIAPEALRTYHRLVNQTQQQPTRRRGGRQRRTARPASISSSIARWKIARPNKPSCLLLQSWTRLRDWLKVRSRGSCIKDQSLPLMDLREESASDFANLIWGGPGCKSATPTTIISQDNTLTRCDYVG
ncbi:uncharacterized protein NECHADRAFT_88862 [Fusarium vanettenii 77-13-4]|uniref:Chromo domain-containing protein n=1 Tax=Fusarium vanettenii (strain ATCC MYA-4622 / CBS 123669 / FGSC 9596 / NRRL 45880 / 77-13-4) TaxID=660122 RepID=C7ZN46_FUSV7|nr:uncharacterized protein NECHADRAFT_88862 [Fusarium vanettenii 77-13-4]EEU34557.1 hypothetical protein NECHADRAFT_88862 [Fusarium vanettenii 77-13-4]